MATSSQDEVLECPECGGEMELKRTFTKKSFPLVGKETEVGEFICQDCGMGRRYERSDPTDSWT